MTDQAPETQITPVEAAPVAFTEGISPIAMLEMAGETVKYMTKNCMGEKYVSNIQGRKYPKVEWWTTAGMALQMFPRVVSESRVPDDNVTWEATVEVWRHDQLITRASAMCSSAERSWANRDEHAIRSMAATRATSKAYRIGLSCLAVMAELEPTPAEEMPPADNRLARGQQAAQQGRMKTEDDLLNEQRQQQSGETAFDSLQDQFKGVTSRDELKTVEANVTAALEAGAITPKQRGALVNIWKAKDRELK